MAQPSTSGINQETIASNYSVDRVVSQVEQVSGLINDLVISVRSVLLFSDGTVALIFLSVYCLHAYLWLAKNMTHLSGVHNSLYAASCTSNFVTLAHAVAE